MRVSIFYLAAIFLLSCSSVTERQLSIAEMDAVEKAENFVLRHGYTNKAHPLKLSVEKVEVFDGILSDEELKDRRNNSLHEFAFGIIDLGGGSFYVLFRLKEPEGEIQPILVEDGVATQVVHSNIRKRGLSYVKVPGA